MARKTVPPGTPPSELPKKDFWAYDRKHSPRDQHLHFIAAEPRYRLYISICKRFKVRASRIEPGDPATHHKKELVCELCQETLIRRLMR